MIRLGIIGCGGMGRAHSGTADELRDRMRFTAFADPDLNRARELAVGHPEAVVLRDFRDLFDRVDGVIVAVPHDRHYEIGMACLKAGKHLLMEKPLAMTESECRKLIGADKSPNPVLMPGYVMRHHPLWNKMGEYIRDKTFGEVFQVSVWTEQLTEATDKSWLGQATRLGGGQLFSHGCHYIDLLLHWMGQPVSGTHIGTNLGTPWMEREGSSNVSLKFAGGATAYHFGTWGARGSRLRYSVHAHCTVGMLELDHVAGTIRLIRDRSGGDLPAMEGPEAGGESVESPNEVVVYRLPGEGGKPLVEQMRAFLDCIELRKKPGVSAAGSLASLEVIWKLYRAEDLGVVADLTGVQVLPE